eukprot:291910-Chlamydomonas_euryale.AAC.1
MNASDCSWYGRICTVSPGGCSAAARSPDTRYASRLLMLWTLSPLMICFRHADMRCQSGRSCGRRGTVRAPACREPDAEAGRVCRGWRGCGHEDAPVHATSGCRPRPMPAPSCACGLQPTPLL